LPTDRSKNVFAVDPGEAKSGFAWLQLLAVPARHPHSNLGADDRCYDDSSDHRLHIRRCFTVSPWDLADYLETNLWRADVLVIERFQLYPWMARQQGFSTFGTAESIGIYKRIAHKVGIPVHLQDASGNKKNGRRRARDWGFKMVDRKLGSGKFVYYGPDFDLPGKLDRRDAAAHACEFVGATGLYEPRDVGS
jgi:hypothetical protein